METTGLIWMLLPVLGIIVFAVMRPFGSMTGKSVVKGLIIAALVYGVYYIWRMTQGSL